MDDENTKSILLTYKNWRGELTTRYVLPVRVWRGRTEYHPETQWILTAYCMTKKERRDFALKDCNFTENT